jgi:fatty acyl-CoA reductase
VSPTVAAFFDVDGTLTRSTVVEPLAWFQRDHLPPGRFALWGAFLLLQVPLYWALDQVSRRAFNVAFFRRYRGLRIDDLRRWHRATFPDNLGRVIYTEGRECLRRHQEQGHRVVLVTGGLDFIVQPLADFLGADDLISHRLEERDGVCTGRLGGPPMAGAQKALLLRGYAQMHGLDLAASYAYADSMSDAAMLACVGHAAVVWPGRRLRRLARTRGWEILEWR